MEKNEIKGHKESNKTKGDNNDLKDNGQKQSEGNVLDTLFLKTKTKPYIYYLPLTDEQVKQKLENKKNNNLFR